MSRVESELRKTIVSWAETTPRIRRVWALGSSAKASTHADDGVNLAIEVEPVADSEETISVWIANGEKWRSQLQQRAGRAINLEWLDPDGSTPAIKQALNSGADLMYERAS